MNIENLNKKPISETATNTEEYRTLPSVSILENLSPLQKIAKGTRISKDYKIQNASGEVVGDFTLSIAQPLQGNATAFLNTIKVTERGKGYGRSTYVKIIEQLKNQNITFYSSDTQLSRDSKKVWDWLVSEGKAEIVDEGVTFNNAEHGGYSTTRYKAL